MISPRTMRDFAAKASVIAAILVFGCEKDEPRQSAGSADAAPPATLRVVAGASVERPLRAIESKFEATSGVHVDIAAPGSNQAVASIENDTAADVIFVARTASFDRLEKSGKLAADSAKAIAGNRLVIVRNPRGELPLKKLTELVRLREAPPWRGRIATASAREFASGEHAKQLLDGASVDGGTVSAGLGDRWAVAASPPAALNHVYESKRYVAIVYATDVDRTKAEVIYEHPVNEAPRVRYVAAVVAKSARPEDARKFVEFLAGPEARRILDEQGFGPP